MIRSATWWHHNHCWGLENPTLIKENQLKKKHHDHLFHINSFVRFGSKSRQMRFGNKKCVKLDKKGNIMTVYFT
jgi:hypothetical protein